MSSGVYVLAGIRVQGVSVKGVSAVATGEGGHIY